MFFQIKKRQQELAVLEARIEKAKQVIKELNNRNVTAALDIVSALPPVLDWSILNAVAVSRDTVERTFITKVEYLNSSNSISTMKFVTNDDAHENIVKDFVRWLEKNNVQL